MNPFQLFILTVRMGVAGEKPGTRTIGFTDEAAAFLYGKKLRLEKPAEATSFEFEVTPLEGV